MKKKKKKERGIDTIVGLDTRFEGNLEFNGAIRLDGKVKGKITSSDGTIIVGESAKIHADISVDVARIMGEVHGTVEAQERIEIHKPARVVGDLRAPVIAIDAGVNFNGNCEMTSRTIAIADASEPPVKAAAKGGK